jgi:hypothetical protein
MFNTKEFIKDKKEFYKKYSYENLIESPLWTKIASRRIKKDYGIAILFSANSGKYGLCEFGENNVLHADNLFLHRCNTVEDIDNLRASIIRNIQWGSVFSIYDMLSFKISKATDSNEIYNLKTLLEEIRDMLERKYNECIKDIQKKPLIDMEKLAYY